MLNEISEKKKEVLVQGIDAVAGSFIFALGVNVLITPLGLYNGGFMGIAQLLRTFVVQVMHVPVPGGLDLSGLIYFIMNIPLFYLGYRVLGRQFAVKTLITVAIQSIFLMIIPIPATPVIDDYLTSCIIGGIVAGTGTGLVLRGRSSGISKAVMEQLGRGVTNWDGEGAYTNKTSYILFVMISKYEVGQIKRIVHSIDPDAFMIFTEGCAVDGNFEKRL